MRITATARRGFMACVVMSGATALAGCGQSRTEALQSSLDGVVERYCTDCHNDTDFTAGLSLESVTAEHVQQDPETWEKVVRKLRGDLMPPPGGPAPAREDRARLVGLLEASLDARARRSGPEPGRVPIHRLNRTEYARSVKELLGMDIDAQALLPADVSSDGFDNVADVLRVSPTHIDQYLSAARDISIRAVGAAHPQAERADYRSDLENGTEHVDGLPLGTRGGMSIEHDFPADGEYVFNINVGSKTGTNLRAYPQGWIEYRHRLIMTIDGERVFEGDLGGEEDSKAIDQHQTPAVEEIKNRFRNIRLKVPAGRHEIGVTFVARTHAESDYLLESLVPGEGVPDIPRIHGTEIIGPYDATGISDSTESRKRIFICRPETQADEQPCAKRILANLARRAFRRPVTDGDLEPLMQFYRYGAKSGGFEKGIQKGLMAILASTKFLYRAEPDPPENAAPGSAYPISDIELAWRLAFFLWSEGPDDELLDVAAAGKLGNEDVLDAQVTRMLADPRAKSLVTNFAFQWLDVRKLDQIDPDVRLYPNFDEDLRAAFRREMELFLESVLLSDKSVLDLLDAKYTFVNERLARHYGIPSVRGDQFRRVELKDSHRFGLLGKGSVLLVTSYPDRTSPVLRGVWIMDHLLGTPPSSPPPSVNTNLTAVEGEKPRSVRERLALHRTNPSCNHCHGVIDPYGNPLENLDVLGEWRTRERDSGVSVDPTGVIAGGGPKLTGVDDLRRALLAEPDQFVQALTEKLMTFALGRGVEYYDMPTVRAIVRRAADNGYRFESIVRGIVHSVPFQMRAVPRPDEAGSDVVASNVGGARAGDGGAD